MQVQRYDLLCIWLSISTIREIRPRFYLSLFTPSEIWAHLKHRKILETSLRVVNFAGRKESLLGMVRSGRLLAMSGLSFRTLTWEIGLHGPKLRDRRDDGCQAGDLHILRTMNQLIVSCNDGIRLISASILGRRQLKSSKPWIKRSISSVWFLTLTSSDTMEWKKLQLRSGFCDFMAKTRILTCETVFHFPWVRVRGIYCNHAAKVWSIQRTDGQQFYRPNCRRTALSALSIDLPSRHKSGEYFI